MTAWWADPQGLLYPGPAGAPVDLLASAARLATAQRAQALVHDALAEAAGAQAALLRATHEALARLDAERRIALFAHPLACLDAPPADHGETPEPRTPLRRACMLARHLIGHPDGPPLALVLDAATLGEGLHLPHLGLTLLPQGDAVIGVRQTPGRLVLVRSDGAALTLPIPAPALPALAHPLVRVEPRAGPLALLNGVPEAVAAFADFDPARPAEAAAELPRLEQGLALLRTAWPQAADAIARHLGAVLVLRRRGHERSHTPRSLAGAVLTTVGAPWTLGDLLCHEASHVRLQQLRRLDPLWLPRDAARAAAGFDSPWRSDKRPLEGLLLGVHAFLNVCEWYRRVPACVPEIADAAQRIRQRQARHVVQAMATLQQHGQPTPGGRALAAAMQQAVAALAQTTGWTAATPAVACTPCTP